jgi:hypothetical protein
LVIPEGLELECLILFDFALAAAAAAPDTEFLLRMHPVLPFEQLARRYRRFRDMPRNVFVSSEPEISTDFARCDWALYRGSSAVVHAVLAGVRPVYVERAGELGIDPLFALRSWRRSIATVEDLGGLVRADRLMCRSRRAAEWEPARAFCDRYIVPAKPHVVRELLAR